VSQETDCKLCELLETQEIYYEDPQWALHQIPGLEVPGWLVMSMRRHGDGVVSMNAEEAATFGPTLAGLSAAVKEVTDAERVYLFAFGDEITHWHIMLAARPADVPKDQRRGAFYQHAASYLDPPAAERVAHAIRDLVAGQDLRAVQDPR